MKTSLTLRLISAAVSIAVTTVIFSAVVSIAEQPQADGTVRLAHTVVGSPQVVAPALVAQAQTNQAR